MNNYVEPEPNRITVEINLDPLFLLNQPIDMGGYAIASIPAKIETHKERTFRQLDALAELLINPKGTRNRIDNYD